jgi:hypothetical protein
MYQTRHTFDSLMLSHGEDLLWVALMLGHTSIEMPYLHYGKFIRNRMRRDGAKFLKGFEETDVSVVLTQPRALPEKEGEESEGSRGHKLGTICKFVVKKKGATQLRNPLK